MSEAGGRAGGGRMNRKRADFAAVPFGVGGGVGGGGWNRRNGWNECDMLCVCVGRGALGKGGAAELFLPKSFFSRPPLSCRVVCDVDIPVLKHEWALFVALCKV